MQPRLRLAYPGTRIDEETSEIVIIDNGIGMSDKDVRIKYLRIGRDRREKLINQFMDVWNGMNRLQQ